jgi:hypothetical protein
MATPAEKLEAMLKDFDARTKTATEHPGNNLRDLLDKSPDLKARILDSIDKGHLQKFDPLPAGANAGGTYNSGNKTIELPMDYMKRSNTDKAAAAELIFVMGHEIQHSFNSTASDKAVDGFKKQVDAIAKGASPHDYTAAVKGFIDNFRKDEAGAHIGGFNAIASQVLKENPKATLKDFYNANPGRMEDFIDRSGTAPKFTYAMKPGLVLDKDQHLPATDKHVAAMGKYYFDQPPSSAHLGTKGNQDYPNYYGEWALNQIQRTEKREQDAALKADPKHVAPEIKINLKDIGLDKSLIDTGLRYTDSSPRKRPLDEAPTHTPGDGAEKRPRAEAPATPTTQSPLYTQALAALEKLGHDGGLKTREEITAVAAAMAVRAQGDGLSRIDSVVKSTTQDGLFAVQGDVGSPSAMRSYVDRADAAKQSPEANLAQLQPVPQVAMPETQLTTGGPSR